MKRMTLRYIKITIHSRIALESFIRTNISTLTIEKIRKEKKDIQYHYINKKL